jgi:DNA repair protein RadD
MTTLRDYQERAVLQVEAAWATGEFRIVLSMPTGSGKTEVALELIRRARGRSKRGLVVTDRRVLATQTKARFERQGHRVGLLQGENTLLARDDDIIVATIQTLLARWDRPWVQRVIDETGVVVIDETHIWHEHHDRLLDRLLSVPLVGLTATPLRAGLGLRYDRIVTPVTIAELQTAKHLVATKCFAPGAARLLAATDELGVRGGDFVDEALSRLMRSKAIIGDVVSTWQAKAAGRPTLAFCVDRAHAAELTDQFRAAGVAAAYVDYLTGDEERARLFAQFRAGEIKVLCSVAVLAIGFDEPCASCAILARPTLSLSLHIQQAGRVLRPFEGKSDALLLDHAANTVRHGRPEDFVPPSVLSEIDRHSDRKRKDARADVAACSVCGAVYPAASRACPDCGHLRVRKTAVVVVDGELRRVDVDEHPEAAEGPTASEVRDFYRMMSWACASRGWKRGRAYYLTLRRFRLRDGYRLPSDWSLDDPLPPDEAADRWLTNENRRAQIAYRARRPV